MTSLKSRTYILILLLLLFYQCKQAAETDKKAKIAKPSITKNDTLRMIFIGDIMQHIPQVNAAYNQKSGDYDYDECFKYMKKYWNNANIVVGNLETTLSDRNFSGYPMFCSPYQLVRDLKKNGVNTLVTANNHSLDKGASGVLRSIYYLDSMMMDYTGVLSDTLKKRHIVLCKEGFRVALLNYTYGTNGLRIPKGIYVPLIDTLSIKKDIEAAKKDKVSNIVVFVHWGVEYEKKHNKEQEMLADMLQRNGVDIIVGSHPHVVQTMTYNKRGIDTVGVRVYSLGNFISNQTGRFTDSGISAVVEIIKYDSIRMSYNLSYINHFVYKHFSQDKYKYVVIPEYDIDSILNKQSRKEFELFISHTNKLIDTTINNIVDSVLITQI